MVARGSANVLTQCFPLALIKLSPGDAAETIGEVL